jgi:hypothetical protein
MKTAVDFTSSPDQIDAILAIAKNYEGVEEVSEPTALDASKALNAGITPEMIEGALTFITIVFQTGKAALDFLKSVREDLNSRGGPPVVLAEPATGKQLGQVKGDTTDDALKRVLPP